MSREGGEAATTREPGDLPSENCALEASGRGAPDGTGSTAKPSARSNKAREPVQPMDRETSANAAATLTPAGPCGPMLISVCITCKRADGAVVGPEMLTALQTAIGSADR